MVGEYTFEGSTDLLSARFDRLFRKGAAALSALSFSLRN